MRDETFNNPVWNEYPTDYINITKQQIDNLLSVEEIMDIYDNFRNRWLSAEDIPGEVWVPIEELNKKYSISCYGRMRENDMPFVETDKKGIIQRRAPKKKILNTYTLNRNDYPEVIMKITHKHFTIHRLVATYFIKKAEESFALIDHKNTIKTCAHIFNLWWCDSKLNSLNPLTQRKQSRYVQTLFKYPDSDENASNEDKIEDYLNTDMIFSSRMLTDVDFAGEEWKYLHLYDIYVSNYGRLKKYIEEDKKFKLMKQTPDKLNYLSITINNSTRKVHYLILYAFGVIENITRYENNMTIDHINTKPYDNRLSNLRYVSFKENVANASTRENMSNSYNKDCRKRELLFYSAKDKKFEFEIESITDAANMLGIPKTTIFNYINKNKPVKKKWYIVEKTSDKIDEYIEVDEQKDNYKKKIGKYDKYGRLIEVYDNVRAIVPNKNKANDRFYWSIIRCCKDESSILDDCQWRFYIGQDEIEAYKSDNENFVNSYNPETGEYLKSFLSAKEAAEYYNIFNTTVYNCCNLIGSRSQNANVTFRYVRSIKDKRNLFEIIDYNPDDFKNTNYRKHSQERINKYDLFGNFVESYKNIQCFEEIIDRTMILKCCTGARKMFKDYMWKFAKDCHGHSNIESYKTEIAGLQMKVNQYDYNGNFIQQFNSCQELSKHLHMAAQMFNNHINDFSRETIWGHYYRYTANSENTLNLWESGLFNGSEISKDIVEMSRYNVNPIDSSAASIIDVYDATDGFIIKRYYSKGVCAEELKVSVDKIVDDSIIDSKFYIKFGSVDSDVLIKVDVKVSVSSREKTQGEIDFINNRERRAELNNIVVYNYYTKEEIGTYDINEASLVTGIHKIAIINCCEGEYKSFVNINTLEEYTFCYEFDKENFSIEYDENVSDDLYALYLTETKELFHVFYSNAELNNFIGYNICGDNIHLLNGKYYLKVFKPGDIIENRIDIPDMWINVHIHNQNTRLLMPKILKFGLDGKYIETFDNLSEITDKNTEKNKIRSCCNGQNKSAYGFQWKFEKDCNGTEDISPVVYKTDRKKKKVDAFKQDGTYISTFNDMTEAAKHFGISPCKVSSCCLGLQDNCIAKIDGYDKITFKYAK